MINRSEKLRKLWNGWQQVPAGSSFLSALLFVLSTPYAVVMCLRNIFYDCGLLRVQRLSCPVISIGNLTMGGTGKTPLVIMLADMLRTLGYKPAILSRGYGRTSDAKVAVVTAGGNLLMTPREAGDEPYLMAQLLHDVPVIVGACRFQTGQVAIEQGADILLLDDGFQHRALYRDVDIVLLDKDHPLGNGRLLPGGSLRESPRALRRADIAVLTGGGGPAGPGLPPARQGLLDDVPHLFQADHRARAIIDGSGAELPLDFLQGKRVYAFAGIGRPLSFRRTIEGLGADLTGFAVFSDHHCFKASELATITREAAQARSDIILTTEKDGVRLSNFKEFSKKLFLLRVEMTIMPAGAGFLDVILEKLRTNQQAGESWRQKMPTIKHSRGRQIS